MGISLHDHARKAAVTVVRRTYTPRIVWGDAKQFGAREFETRSRRTEIEQIEHKFKTKQKSHLNLIQTESIRVLKSRKRAKGKSISLYS